MQHATGRGNFAVNLFGPQRRGATNRAPALMVMPALIFSDRHPPASCFPLCSSGKKKEKEGRLEPETVNDGPKASLTFADQTVAGYAEKKPLLEGGDDGDEEEEDAFPTAQPNTKVV